MARREGHRETAGTSCGKLCSTRPTDRQQAIITKLAHAIMLSVLIVPLVATSYTCPLAFPILWTPEEVNACVFLFNVYPT